MITEKEAIEMLRSSCEHVAPYWEKHLEFWGGEVPGFYNDIAIIADYVVDRYEKGTTNDFPAIFEAVEKIISHSTHPAKELAVIGFLEGVQNAALSKKFGPKPFIKWLGPESRQACQELNDFWERVISWKNDKAKTKT